MLTYISNSTLLLIIRGIKIKNKAIYSSQEYETTKQHITLIMNSNEGNIVNKVN